MDRHRRKRVFSSDTEGVSRFTRRGGRMMDQKEVYSNHTTPHISPLQPRSGFHGYCVLIAAVLLTAAVCVAVVVVCVRRRSRSVELRHRLIPVYSYDPTEEGDDWGEEDNLATASYKKGTLFLSAYGT